MSKLRIELDAPPPATEDAAQLAIAWHRKAAAEKLQEVEKRTEYLEKALNYARRAQLASSGTGGYQRVRQDYALSLWFSRSAATSQDSMVEFATELEQSQGNLGMLMPTYFHIISNYVPPGQNLKNQALT